MDWLIPALAATSIFACIGVVDKIAISRYFRNTWSYPFYTSLFLSLYSFLILLGRMQYGAFTTPSPSLTFVALLPGLLHFLSSIFYTRALLYADASTVFGLSQASPIFALLWGTVIFTEILRPANYLGVIAIVTCALLLGWERGPGAMRQRQMSRAVGLILLAAFLRSLAELFLKVAVTDLAYWDAFALSRIGTIIPALALLTSKKRRAQLMQPLVDSGLRIVAVVGIIEVFALVNLALLTLAFALGPLALVSATQSTLPLFIVGLTSSLNYLKPKLVPAQGSAWQSWVVITLCIGIVAGVYLLHVGR